MRRELALLSAIFLVALFISEGCKRGADSPDLSKLGPSSAAASALLPVGSPQCPGGGMRIDVGSDTNGNGILEAGEALKGTPICDPQSNAKKPSGLASLVMIASEPSGTLRCAAGGLKVLSGPDADKNGLLDPNEIMFTEYLCNGAPGSSSAAGITVAVAPAAASSLSGDKKKAKKPAQSKKPQAAPGQAAASQPATEDKAAQAAPAASPKKAQEKARRTSSNKEKSGSAKPAAVPQGWTSVNVGAPQLASAAYKIEGRSIIVRFTNLSTASVVRFKYTVRWKVKQNGNWVDDSSVEGISFRLKPQESLDREVRAQSQDIRDVVVDLNVGEAS